MDNEETYTEDKQSYGKVDVCKEQYPICSSASFEDIFKGMSDKSNGDSTTNIFSAQLDSGSMYSEVYNILDGLEKGSGYSLPDTSTSLLKPSSSDEQESMEFFFEKETDNSDIYFSDIDETFFETKEEVSIHAGHEAMIDVIDISSGVYPQEIKSPKTCWKGNMEIKQECSSDTSYSEYTCKKLEFSEFSEFSDNGSLSSVASSLIKSCGSGRYQQEVGNY
ncbi:hypothetical protein AX774_g3395 [Zancudomyces culisetae]|uniref:Uncharacterized protein n=1 Tax=Zancudomyces culisetae TaxID=1213189 RepID=A0A1R1PQ61_ZANCU|nr:hypothetical protein AX774_g3395 [Zancudomyces culisetae]|eukprot:OMH83097.1 hypothetical protein AX774_g3395 [Zancudomyces culisetae]